jgi:hypothetical protein
MFVASWGDNVSVIGSAGTNACVNCKNTREHLLVDVRKKVSVMFLPVGSFAKGKYTVCPVCREMTKVNDGEAARLVLESLKSDVQ